MVSAVTLNNFIKSVRIGTPFTVSILMKRLKISRPTATNIISTMLNRRNYKKRKLVIDHKIIPIGKPHSKEKWYILVDKEYLEQEVIL